MTQRTVSAPAGRRRSPSGSRHSACRTCSTRWTGRSSTRCCRRSARSSASRSTRPGCWPPGSRWVSRSPGYRPDICWTGSPAGRSSSPAWSSTRWARSPSRSPRASRTWPSYRLLIRCRRGRAGHGHLRDHRRLLLPPPRLRRGFHRGRLRPGCVPRPADRAGHGRGRGGWRSRSTSSALRAWSWRSSCWSRCRRAMSEAVAGRATTADEASYDHIPASPYNRNALASRERLGGVGPGLLRVPRALPDVPARGARVRPRRRRPSPRRSSGSGR